MDTNKTDKEEQLIPDYDGLFNLIGTDNKSYEEMDEKVRSYDYEQNKWLYETFACFLLDDFTVGFEKYDDKLFKKVKKAPLYSLIAWYAEKLEHDFLKAAIAFWNQDYVSMRKHLYNNISNFSSEKHLYNADNIGVDYLRVFKNGYPGFWNDLSEMFKKFPSEPYMPELLKAISMFYESTDSEEIRNALIAVGRKIPDGYIVNELLALSYSEDKMWKNALSYYETLPSNENGAMFYMEDLAFSTAWAASKAKEPIKAIKYYEKCIELSPTYRYARNNLGYELYKSKQYDKAKSLFEKLLDNAENDIDKLEMSCVCNNYTRVLLALKQYDEAKEFIDTHKVAKGIAQSVERAIERREQKSEEVEEDIKDGYLDEDDLPEEAVTKHFGKKKAQFSTEKILEDELERKILDGIEIFGKRLRMYEHDGDMYGRQYVIPIGRLDLLCEDDKGDYWIIELKKDTGYDDPYDQTVAYLDWFEKNKAKKGQKVYGIICLNSPSKALVQKIKADPRIKLFEYRIEYTEIK